MTRKAIVDAEDLDVARLEAQLQLKQQDYDRAAEAAALGDVGAAERLRRHGSELFSLKQRLQDASAILAGGERNRERDKADRETAAWLQAKRQMEEALQKSVDAAAEIDSLLPRLGELVRLHDISRSRALQLIAPYVKDPRAPDRMGNVDGRAVRAVIHQRCTAMGLWPANGRYTSDQLRDGAQRHAEHQAATIRNEMRRKR